VSRSLQRHLSKILAMAVLVCGVVATLVAFYFAYSEAQEFQDDTLRQIAALSAGSRSEIQQLDAANKVVEDPESRIRVVSLPAGPRPEWLPPSIEPGFHTLAETAGHGEMRVFVRDTGNGRRLVVAQSTDSRNEIALNSTLRTLIPLLMLLPILIGLIAFIVRGEFMPIRRLSENLDRQAAERPTRLPQHDLSEEITPFVEAINRLLERVEKMIAEQRRFIADAAHELRTPITALSLQAQNLAQAESPEEMRERLIPLQTGIERARRLTVQLLDLARLQASVATTYVEVDLRALAREVMAECHPVAEAKGIDLGMDEAGLTSIQSDPRALGLIIRNALENAIKYTPHGGEVTLRLRKGGQSALIEVVDNGPGIPTAELWHAFDAFHRLSNGGEGSGLGLAIAREAAVRLGGTVGLSNREDGPGLVFSYTQSFQPNG
jgi:two-component system OmpR family sensor kinase